MDYRELVESRRQRRNRALAWLAGSLIAVFGTVAWLITTEAFPGLLRAPGRYASAVLFVGLWTAATAVIRKRLLADPLGRHERLSLISDPMRFPPKWAAHEAPKVLTVHVLDPAGGLREEFADMNLPDDVLDTIGPKGAELYRVERWVVGRDLSAEQYAEFLEQGLADEAAGELFVTIAMRRGERTPLCVTRKDWLAAANPSCRLGRRPPQRGNDEDAALDYLNDARGDQQA